VLYMLIQLAFAIIPIGGALASLILGPPIAAGFLFMGINAYSGHKIQAIDMFAGFSRFGTLLGLAYLRLLIFAACMIPMLVLGILGTLVAHSAPGLTEVFLVVGLAGSLILVIGFGLRLFFSEPVCLARCLSVFDCMKTSWAMTKPIAGRLLLFLIVLGLIVFAVALIGVVVAAAVAGAGSTGAVKLWIVVLAGLCPVAAIFLVGMPFILGAMGAAYGLASSNVDDG